MKYFAIFSGIFIWYCIVTLADMAVSEFNYWLLVFAPSFCIGIMSGYIWSVEND